MTRISSTARPLAKRAAPRSAYIHIPFCRRRCYYCDFPISVLGAETDASTSPWVEEYVQTLCAEIAATPALESLSTVFFGGGTPSLLSASQLQRILVTVERRLKIASDAEISIEMDPGTFSLQQLQEYKAAGINRISLGIQAFQDELLAACGRSHSQRDIFTAIDLIHQVEIPNFSLDLISGLPQQTLAQWQHSLTTAIAIAPQHISCYDLVLEPTTAFGRRYQAGNLLLPEDDLTAQMYRLAQQMLVEAGYEHYEISNYAQPGYQCRHNRVYWENKPYYGFGMGATSYVNQQRMSRPRTRREYYVWVQQLASNGSRAEDDSDTDELLETLMLGLRLADGISLSRIEQQFGQKTVEQIWTCLQPFLHQGLVEAVEQPSSLKETHTPIAERVRLSDPEGFLLSNTVLAALFKQLD
ncbi:MAG: radical SAM family heme chaperone HemW [Cyanophyceae cyanobacterium]